MRLRASGLTRAFDGVLALGGVSFDLRAGEVHALVGENGAGKSTLVRILAGALAPDRGEVAIDGAPVTIFSPAEARRRGVAAIYQQPALFPHLTVAENVALGLEPGGMWGRVDWSGRRDRARRLLDRLGAHVPVDAEAGTLRFAEQQLVEIARAVGAGAGIVIMDEPTAALTPQEVTRLFAIVGELTRSGTGVIYISHRLDELARIADRITVLRDGEVVATHDSGEVAPAALIREMVGRDLDAGVPAAAAAPGAPALELEGVDCLTTGVSAVTLSVAAGEIVGLAGLVGAGRTELARVLFGLTPATGGVIRVKGRPVTLGSPAEALAAGLALVPEDRRRHGVIPDLPVAANLSLAVLETLVARRGFLQPARERALAEEYHRRLAIKMPSIHTPVAHLSGGNQQKVALGRMLARRPSVLVLDEPTQGVDVGAKAEIHRLMRELASDGAAILMISSELPEVLGMSDRVAVMRGGRLVASFDRAEATSARVMSAAFGEAA